MTNKWHIIKTNKGWGLKKEGATRLTKDNIGLNDAIDKLWELKQSSELYIHGEDGRVVRKITISEELK